MALVAYDNSDTSDYEEDDNESASVPVVILNKKSEEPITKTSNNDLEKPDATDSEQSQNLFNHLPQPTQKKKAPIIEEDDEFLHKKETVTEVKPKCKITVPSLNDFKDVKDTVPHAKPKVVNGKKSGLLSILPQPKNASIITTISKALIPHVLTQGTTAKKKEPMSNKKAKSESKSSSKTMSNSISQCSDDSDNEDDVQNDFFSIHKQVEVLPLEELPLDLERPSSSKARETSVHSKPRSIESYFKQDSNPHPVNEDPDNVESSVTSDQGFAQSSDHRPLNGTGEIALDEEAIRKLCGSRGKRKREEIQIVDVNQQEVLADAREWLLKGLMDDTSKRTSASKKRGNEPTSQQKRKHQITYLAHQAKANEIELQNQWASNRMTKRQTQSKYGF